MALEFRQRLAAVDEAARDRLADIVVILQDRLDQVLADADPFGPEGMEALAEVPAVVAALDQEVDLLVQVLPHLAGPELTGLAIERHPPHVPQAVTPDFRPRVLAINKGIVLGN